MKRLRCTGITEVTKRQSKPVESWTALPSSPDTQNALTTVRHTDKARTHLLQRRGLSHIIQYYISIRSTTSQDKCLKIMATITN